MSDVRVARDGDTVSVHYTGSLSSGDTFDSSRGGSPLSFELGSGGIIPGFESAVRGMAVGDTTKVELEPDQAYGQRREDLVVQVPAAQAPDGLSVGDQVQVGQHRATVVACDPEQVVIDANHPLAGEKLIFEIELVDARSPS